MGRHRKKSAERLFFGAVEGTIEQLFRFIGRHRSLGARTRQAAASLDRAKRLVADGVAQGPAEAFEAKSRELSDLHDKRVRSFRDHGQRVRFEAAFASDQQTGLSYLASLRAGEDAAAGRQPIGEHENPALERFREMKLSDQFKVIGLVASGVATADRAWKEVLIRTLGEAEQRAIRMADRRVFESSLKWGASRAKAHKNALEGRYFELGRMLGKPILGTLSLADIKYDWSTVIQMLPAEARERVVDNYKQTFSSSAKSRTVQHAAGIASQSAGRQLTTELFCLLSKENLRELKALADEVYGRETAAGQSVRDADKMSKAALKALASLIGSLVIEKVPADQLGLSATDLGLSPRLDRKRGRHAR